MEVEARRAFALVTEDFTRSLLRNCAWLAESEKNSVNLTFTKEFRRISVLKIAFSAVVCRRSSAWREERISREVLRHLT